MELEPQSKISLFYYNSGELFFMKGEKQGNFRIFNGYLTIQENEVILNTMWVIIIMLRDRYTNKVQQGNFHIIIIIKVHYNCRPSFDYYYCNLRVYYYGRPRFEVIFSSSVVKSNAV